MKNWLRIIFFLTLFGLFGVTQAMAVNPSINISIDYAKKVIRVQGTAAAGSNITVLVINPHGSPEYIDQTTSDSGGKYVFAFPASGESGTYQVCVGGTGSTAPLKTTYDYNTKLPDTPIIVSPAFPFTGKTTPELVVRSQADTVIQVFENTALIASAPGNGTDIAIQLPPLGEGTHTLKVTALNAAGLGSTEVTLSLTIDTIVPKVPEVELPDTPIIVSPAFPFTGKTTPELVVRSQADTVIQIFENTALIASAPGNGTDTAIQLPPLGEGTHTLKVKALNAAGLGSTEVTLSLTIDTITPKAPEVDSVRLGQSTATGKAEAFSTVTVWRGNDIIGSVQTRADGTFTVEIGAQSVGTILTFVAKDLAGNESIATKVTVIFFFSSGSSGSSSVQTPSSGTDSEANAGAKPDSNKTEMNFGASEITLDKRTDGTSTAKVMVDPAKLDLAIRNLLASKPRSPKLVLNIKDISPSTRIVLPATVLADLAKTEPAMVISMKVGTVSYDLPVSGLNTAYLVQQLGVNIKDATVNVILDKVQGNTALSIQNQANRDGAKLLVDPVDFSIMVEAGGKRVEVKTFESLYISRTFELPATVSPQKTTGVIIDPSSGEQQFVPTVFSSADGKSWATLKRNGNSIYSVVEYSKSYADINAHWAKTDIELLASKRVVKGTSESRFAPDDKITRAEFAALLVRALGLSEVKDNATFHDVSATDWYSGAVATAVNAGLVSGYDPHTFKPNDSITREQMAVMITNAGAYIKKQVDLAGQEDNLLAKFEDQSRFSPWAKSAVAQVVKVGIIQGMTDNSFVPDDSASRAQAVVMLKRFLQYAEFIN